MSVSTLENRFLAMEDNFDKIIASSKATLQKDKEALQKSPRNAKSILKDDRNAANEHAKGFSLNLGGYEKQTPKQKQLCDERQREYRKYLSEQMSKSGRSNTHVNNDIRNEEAQPISRKEEYRRQIDQEYKDLLKKKQDQEKVYRVQFNDDNADKGNEVIVLDSRDNDLIELLKSRRRGKSAETERSTKFKEMRGDSLDYGRANSVPPSVPPILGGNSNTQLNKQKQQKYKLELEEQMKENQLLKAKEKLKRLGRVTSDVDVAEIELPKNNKNKWALPVHNKADTSPGTATTNKRNNSERLGDKEVSPHQLPHQHQQPQYLVNNMQQPVINPFYQQPVIQQQYPMGGLPQPGMYQAPTMQAMGMNPMGMNPMMQWQMAPSAYQPMMQPGFNGSGGAQQFKGNPYQQGAGGGGVYDTLDTDRKNSARNRKQWDVPPLDLNGSVNKNQSNFSSRTQHDSSTTSNKMNIPRRPNVQPPGGSGHNLFNSPQTNNKNVTGDGDEATQKRLKQLQYQKELHLQMEIKKEKEAKAKRERERYEQKLEREIEAYDPWGREGAGAPVRNKDGHIVANLKNYQNDHDSPDKPQNHQYQQQQQQQLQQDLHSGDEESPLMKALNESQNKGTLANTYRSPNSSMNAGQNHKSPKTYARGAALKELKGIGSKSPRDQVEQDEYKSFLRQQVEEKQRKADEAKEKARLEEEKRFIMNY
uniref:Uncharacterized protein n=1 Tax=Clytia hemisphaerica TaxID=252671 RepID=A0A7M5V783_9CNID